MKSWVCHCNLTENIYKSVTSDIILKVGWVVVFTALLHCWCQAAWHMRSKPKEPCVTGRFLILYSTNSWQKNQNWESAAKCWFLGIELTFMSRIEIKIYFYIYVPCGRNHNFFCCRIRLDCYWGLLMELLLHNNNYFGNLPVLSATF